MTEGHNPLRAELALANGVSAPGRVAVRNRVAVDFTPDERLAAPIVAEAAATLTFFGIRRGDGGALAVRGTVRESGSGELHLRLAEALPATVPGADQQTETAAGDTPGALLSRIGNDGLAELRRRIRRFLVELGDSLFEQSMSRGYSSSGYNAHYATFNALKKDSDAVQENYLERVERKARTVLEGRGAGAGVEHPERPTELGLVANEEVESAIMHRKMVSALQERAGLELESLRARTHHLLRAAGIETTEPPQAPFAPELLCGAFIEATADLEMDDSVRRDVLRLFDQRFARRLPSLYEALNRMLEAAGVLPGIEQKIERHGSATPRPARRPSAPEGGADGAATRQERSAERARQRAGKDYDPLVEDVVRGVLERLVPGTGPEQALAAAREALASGRVQQQSRDDAASPAPEAIDSALRFLQQRPELNRERDTAQSLREFIDRLAGEHPELAPARGVAGAPATQLDLVDNVFSTLRDDLQVDLGLQPALGELEIPLARLALREPDLFRDREHPAHRMLDALATLSHRENFPNARLAKELAAIIETVATSEDSGDVAFKRAHEQLEQVALRQQGLMERNVERILGSLDGQQKLAEARRDVDRLLFETSEENGMPLRLAGLIDSGWHAALVQTRLKSGAGSAQWSAQDRTVRQLFETLSELSDPKLTAADAETLRLKAGALLSRVEQHIEEILPGHAEHREPARLLRRELSEGNMALAGETYRIRSQPGLSEVRGRARDLPRLNRWLRRVEDLAPGSWLSYRGRDGERRRMRLIWVSDRKDRYVFVNDKGQKVAELSAVRLARLLARGARPPASVERMSVLDQSLYRTIEHNHRRLNFESNRDQLTELLGARAFDRYLQRALRHAKGHQSTHALLLVDIDRFQLVAQLFDEQSAGQVLREFSGLLAQLHGRNIVTAHLNEDDFGILLSHHDLTEARALAENVRADIERASLEVAGEPVSFTVSIGIARILESSTSTEQLLSQAGAALRSAKEQGRNRVVVYDPGQEQVETYRRERSRSEAELREALASQRFVLRAQPVVQLAVDGGETATHHYEILLAVRDEDGQLMSPQVFLDSSERYGFVDVVDRWVVQETFKWISSLMDSRHETPELAINLSGTSLCDDRFLDFLLEQISEYGVGTSKLCFEITETGQLESMTKAADFIRALRNIGCSFALDDFGTGFAGYEYLRELPVDYVKIDGTFIRGIKDNERDYAMAKSINDLAHFLGYQTVAECVETVDVVPTLREIGIDYLQGFGVGRPRLLSTLAEELPTLDL